MLNQIKRKKEESDVIGYYINDILIAKVISRTAILKTEDTRFRGSPRKVKDLIWQKENLMFLFPSSREAIEQLIDIKEIEANELPVKYWLESGIKKLEY